MITALGTKPNIFHSVRAMKTARNKMWAQATAVSFQRSTQLSSYFCSESTDLFIFQKRARDKEVVISLWLAKSFSCSAIH